MPRTLLRNDQWERIKDLLHHPRHALIIHARADVGDGKRVLDVTKRLSHGSIYSLQSADLLIAGGNANWAIDAQRQNYWVSSWPRHLNSLPPSAHS